MSIPAKSRPAKPRASTQDSTQIGKTKAQSPISAPEDLGNKIPESMLDQRSNQSGGSQENQLKNDGLQGKLPLLPN